MEIIVQGKGKEFFSPNEVVLGINFNVKDLTYEDVLTKGVNNVMNFVNNILVPNGFTKDDMKTRSYYVNESKRYDEATRKYYPDGFAFNQSATLKFDYDKAKLAKIMDDLSKLENAPNVGVSFGVKDAKECKRKILSKAYEDAKLQAEAIAIAAGKSLVGCAKVDFKPFTTNYISETTFDSGVKFSRARADGALGASNQDKIMTTFTPEDIELNEVLYCLWIAE